MGNTAKQCRLGLFQDSDFAGDLEDSKSTSGGTLCIFGSHTFQKVGCVRNRRQFLTAQQNLKSSRWTVDSSPEPTELLLIGCSIELIWTPKSKSNTSTPKTNSQTSWPKENFTRDEWNHLLTFFNISHFSSTARIAAMAKRAQQESGEGRVTAKSRPMMNLTARTPSFVSSSASSNPERTSHGYQDPGKSVPSDDRTG